MKPKPEDIIILCFADWFFILLSPYWYLFPVACIPGLNYLLIRTLDEQGEYIYHADPINYYKEICYTINEVK